MNKYITNNKKVFHQLLLQWDTVVLPPATLNTSTLTRTAWQIHTGRGATNDMDPSLVSTYR
jgi:hypothetical protein